MQKQGIKIDFSGQNIYVGIDIKLTQVENFQSENY